MISLMTTVPAGLGTEPVYSTVTVHYSWRAVAVQIVSRDLSTVTGALTGRKRPTLTPKSR